MRQRCIPPEPQQSDSHAVIEPSFLTPIFTFAKAEGRCPATFNSWSRSSMSLTGFPVILESLAASTPHLSEANLEPKPPPMYWQSTWMFSVGTSAPRETVPA